MVKLKGPGLATSATGQLANQLIFSSSKGRQYLKQYRKPKQPRSKPQVAMRATMNFLAQQWKTLPSSTQATWNELAATTGISPFNAYQGFNLTRARNAQRPSMVAPAAETGSRALLTYFQGDNGVRSIRIRFLTNDLQQCWGLTVYNVPTDGATPTWQDAIHVIRLELAVVQSWRWTPIAAGTYYFRYDVFTTTGKQHLRPGQLTLTATD